MSQSEGVDSCGNRSSSRSSESEKRITLLSVYESAVRKERCEITGAAHCVLVSVKPEGTCGGGGARRVAGKTISLTLLSRTKRPRREMTDCQWCSRKLRFVQTRRQAVNPADDTLCPGVSLITKRKTLAANTPHPAFVSLALHS